MGVVSGWRSRFDAGGTAGGSFGTSGDPTDVVLVSEIAGGF